MENSELRINRLESIIEQVGEAVIVTTETVEKLAEKVDMLTVQVQNQAYQIQQQGYQIFALTEALQAFVDSQETSNNQREHLTNTINDLIATLKADFDHP